MSIADSTGHSIHPIDSTVDLNSSTCLVYAFGFAGHQTYETIAGLRHIDLFAGADFANWLLTRGHLKEVPPADAIAGALVVYFGSGSTFAHIGILRNDGRIDSKWGNQGLYNHVVFDVPMAYGNRVRYYEFIAYVAAIELFRDFAKEQGVEFE